MAAGIKKNEKKGTDLFLLAIYPLIKINLSPFFIILSAISVSPIMDALTPDKYYAISGVFQFFSKKYST